MVICGKDCQNSCSDNPEKVAEMTLKCLKETVPTEVPGIAFLSGGQSSDKATSHLYNMNSKLNDFRNNFWNLTFSYGRALQEDALNSWKDRNKEKSQENSLKEPRIILLLVKEKLVSMSDWFKRKKQGIYTETKDKKDLPPGLWYKCTNCSHLILSEDFKKQFLCVENVIIMKK